MEGADKRSARRRRCTSALGTSAAPRGQRRHFDFTMLILMKFAQTFTNYFLEISNRNNKKASCNVLIVFFYVPANFDISEIIQISNIDISKDYDVRHPVCGPLPPSQPNWLENVRVVPSRSSSVSGWTLCGLVIGGGTPPGRSGW